MRQFPLEIQDFGRCFVATQRYRHQADYAPEATFSRSQVLELIDEGETALADFGNAAAMDRRAFAIHVLFRLRRD